MPYYILINNSIHTHTECPEFPPVDGDIFPLSNSVDSVTSLIFQGWIPVKVFRVQRLKKSFVILLYWTNKRSPHFITSVRLSIEMFVIRLWPSHCKSATSSSILFDILMCVRGVKTALHYVVKRLQYLKMLIIDTRRNNNSDKRHIVYTEATSTKGKANVSASLTNAYQWGRGDSHRWGWVQLLQHKEKPTSPLKESQKYTSMYIYSQ